MSSTNFQSSLHITHITTVTAILEINCVNLPTDPIFSPEGTKFDVTHLFLEDAPQTFITLDDDPAAYAAFPGQGPIQITMSGEDAAKLVREIGIEHLVPMHFESWHHFTHSGKDLRRIFEKEGIMNKVSWLEPGQKKKTICTCTKFVSC